MSGPYRIPAGRRWTGFAALAAILLAGPAAARGGVVFVDQARSVEADADASELGGANHRKQSATGFGHAQAPSTIWTRMLPSPRVCSLTA